MEKIGQDFAIAEAALRITVHAPELRADLLALIEDYTCRMHKTGERCKRLLTLHDALTEALDGYDLHSVHADQLPLL